MEDRPSRISGVQSIGEEVLELHSDQLDLARLEVDMSRYGGDVPEGEVVELNRGSDTLSSDYFITSTGFLFRDVDTGEIAVGHLDREGWSGPGFLNAHYSRSLKQIVLLSGTSSARQKAVEEQLLDGTYGSVDLRRIDVDSENSYWGFIFNRATNEVKVFIRNGSDIVTTYPAFW